MSQTQTADATPNRRAYTTHVEPHAQGRASYARCTGCEREILTSIGFEKLDHGAGCPNGGT